MIIHSCAQGSPEWFQLHCGIPSGSEFDRIITPGGKLCKAERSTDYRNRKLAEWITGEVVYDPQQYESLHMALGKKTSHLRRKPSRYRPDARCARSVSSPATMDWWVPRPID